MLSTFHDQFLLSKTAVATPPGWQALTCAGWHLVAHQSLPVVRIRTNDGTDAGLALGHLIDREGRYVRDDLRLPAPTASVGEHDIEHLIYTHGGRFACVTLLPGLERLYLDPFGSLAAVWCPERRRAASTTTVLLHDERDHPIFRAKTPAGLTARPNQFYPAGLTSVPGIHRLVVNHFLDLETWTTARHHPRTFAPAAAADIPRIVAGVQDAIRRQIAAVVAQCGGAYIGLTAGRDSRRLLACARDVADRIEGFTLESRRARFGMKWDVDLRTARLVARRAGIRHRVVFMGRSARATGGGYLRRIGYSGGPGKGAKFSGPMRHLDMSRGWMTGHGGGLCLARYFGRMPARLTVKSVLRMLRLDVAPGFTDAVDRWLAGMPDVPPALALDLTIVEHQGGSWIAPHLYGTAPFRVSLLPIAHRDAIDGILSLPPAYRTSGALDRDLFALAWPGLIDLPFNEYSGVRGWAFGVRKALGSGRRIVQRLARGGVSTPGS